MHRYTVKTFGCQMNVHDSDRMHEVLQGAGFEPAEAFSDADLIVLNTCSVRDKAEQKLRSLVGTLGDLKRSRPGLVVAVAGCMAQEHGRELLSKLRYVDLVLGPDHVAELPDLYLAAIGGEGPAVRATFDLEAPAFLSARPEAHRGVRPTTFVTIMKGCDERCSFCIVPYTRGPERYRPSAEILDEIALLVAAGVREVTLLGQTVNSYRDPSAALAPAPDAAANDPDESEFAALLFAIASRVPGLGRLRYTSPHPRHVTASLVRAHRELDVLARHVHLPVQSGSDRVLRRMIRRYTRAEYLERAARLAEARPGLTLSTDIIVGFPGETEQDFQATLELVGAVGFTGLFGFKYSPRPKTASLRFDDDILEDTKKDRLARLFDKSEALTAAHLASLVGTTQRILVEGPSPSGDAVVTGRTDRNEIVHLADARGRDPRDQVGRFVSVRIQRAFKHSLEGSLIDPLAPSPEPATRVRLNVVP